MSSPNGSIIEILVIVLLSRVDFLSSTFVHVEVAGLRIPPPPQASGEQMYRGMEKGRKIEKKEENLMQNFNIGKQKKR